MCHRICPHILAKTQYWKVLVSCAPPSIRPQVNPNHIVQDFVAICQELEPPCHQSSICLLLPPICQQVWEQAKLSWYGSLGHGCENFYIAPILTQVLRQGDIALVPIYTFSTQLQFRSRYWDIEVSQTQIGSCYVLSSLSLQLHADILDFDKTIELDGMVFVWWGAVKSWARNKTFEMAAKGFLGEVWAKYPM